MHKLSFIFVIVFIFIFGCASSSNISSTTNTEMFGDPKPAAYNTEAYFNMLKGKKIALVINQTSTIGNKLLVDSLILAGFNVIKIFAPEHGFRGNADAGAKIIDQKDSKTGLEIVSLYGKKNMPSDEDLLGIDLMIFDIQDVGARFYTYINTLQLVMQACANNDIPLMVLDRPNPNGYFIDGPVLDPKFSSFVGFNPVPVVYGMTIGEYALMVNGEKWLPNKLKCELHVIKCMDYDHNSSYFLPVPPSPNLKSENAILLYPSLCFFEGTLVSVGRGTPHPFECFGYPGNSLGKFIFTPTSVLGATDPPYKGQACTGIDLREVSIDSIKIRKSLSLHYLIDQFHAYKGNDFFLKNGFFDKLAGTDQLRIQIEKAFTEKQIRASWQQDIEHFKTIRKKYLLYKDFE